MSPNVVFGPFRLHTDGGRLLRGAEPVSLTPRAYALLHYLAQRPGHLVTKRELLETLWPDTHVTGEVLKVCVREIRKALGDDARAPRFIETAHRRGYRFIGATAVSGGRPAPAAERAAQAEAPRIVGRAGELGRLRHLLREASRGARRVVFLTGEPGIGKTATMEAFLQEVSLEPGTLIARGQCLQQYGSGEAYLPVLDAFGRLARDPASSWVAELLRRHAPTWLAHLPDLIGEQDRERLHRETVGATPGRMLREMAVAIEALTSTVPLVLALEDLHWSDYSTLDLVSLLASRPEPARLLLIGTYRDLEVRLSRHPLRAVQQELLSRNLCERMPLGYLSQAAVSEYLSERFADLPRLDEIARVIHRRTEGNPLFLVNLVDYAVSKGVLGDGSGAGIHGALLQELARAIPDGLRQLIQRQIDGLTGEERAVLEAASATSMEFSALAVEAALEDDARHVEEVCDRLARRGQFLRPAGVVSLPDGTLSARFGFIHSLYQNVLHDQTPPSRRLRLHQRIAERGVSVFGGRAGEIAAELAMHFEQSRDYRGAVLHLMTAAANAGRRRAYREAIDQLTRARDLSRRLPAGERAACRAQILEQLGVARRSMGDMQGAADDFRALAAWARRHARPESEARGLLYLASAQSWRHGRESLAAARRALAISRRLADPYVRVRTRSFSGYWHLTLRGWTGEGERACATAVAAARRSGDPGVLSQHLVRRSLFLILRGMYDAACADAREGQALALAVNEGFDYLLSQFFLGWALLHAGRWGEALRAADEGIRMAEQNEHLQWADLLRLLRAWLHDEACDFEQSRRLCEPALARDRASGFPVGKSMGLALLGRSALGREDLKEARRRFGEAVRMSRRGPVVMGWYWQMQSHLGLAEWALRMGDAAKVREHTDGVLAVAGGPGDVTALARARALRALAELSAGAPDRAQREADQALALLAARDAPLAEWRAAAAAAEVAAARGADPAPHRERCATVLRRLAGSFEGEKGLRRAFLASGTVRTLAG